jgi:hypothetical protein
MKKIIKIDNARLYAKGEFSHPKSVLGREFHLHIADEHYGARLYLRKRDVEKFRNDLTRVLELWDE